MLLYQAQDNADVFGSNLDTDVHQDLEDKENDQAAKKPTPQAPGAASGAGASGAVDADAEVAAALAAEEQAEGDEIEVTDLEVAWENLDCARAIWERDPQANAVDLAAVHVLLGDVAQENEAFEDSLADYQQALMYQKMAGYDFGDRRTAEVYFKRVMALQFLERPEEALLDVENAKKVLEKRLETIAEDKGNTSEFEDVTAILEDMKEKRTELEALAEEKKAMADAVRGALSKITQKQQAEQGDSSLAPYANKSNITSPVKDLGVVGRGTKRIKLEPAVEEKKSDKEGNAIDETHKDSPERHNQKNEPKRNLDNVLNKDDGGETTIGF